MLVDQFGRKITYLRISVTDKCNLRCIYCMPEEGVKFIPHSEILRIEEIATIARLFIQNGVTKIRITGGEPLVRKGIITLARELVQAMGEKGEVTLTTNGTLLKDYAKQLLDAGIRRINIGIDTLRESTFGRITRRDLHHRAMEGLKVVSQLPFSKIKINVVVMRGINDEEILDFARLTMEHNWEIRFIEYMPFGGVTNEHLKRYLMSGKEILARLKSNYKLTKLESTGSVSERFKIEGAKGEIGIITPMTSHFCEGCNRMRLTANGFLRPCLFSEEMVDIKTPLRNGASTEELLHIIKESVNRKPRINPILEREGRSVPVNMSFLGG